MSSTLFRLEFFSLGRAGRQSARSVNMGSPHILESTRNKKLKFYTPFDSAKYSFPYEIFSAKGRAGGGRSAT